MGQEGNFFSKPEAKEVGQGQTQCGSWYGFAPMLAPGKS